MPIVRGPAAARCGPNWTSTVWLAPPVARTLFDRVLSNNNKFTGRKPPKYLKWIWKSKCTMKIKFFIGYCLLLIDRLNTIDMLDRKKCAPERPCMHLFFECPFSIECWERLQINWNTSSDFWFRTMLHQVSNVYQSCHLLKKSFM